MKRSSKLPEVVASVIGKTFLSPTIASSLRAYDLWGPARSSSTRRFDYRCEMHALAALARTPAILIKPSLASARSASCSQCQECPSRPKYSCVVKHTFPPVLLTLRCLIESVLSYRVNGGVLLEALKGFPKGTAGQLRPFAQLCNAYDGVRFLRPYMLRSEDC